MVARKISALELHPWKTSVNVSKRTHARGSVALFIKSVNRTYWIFGAGTWLERILTGTSEPFLPRQCCRKWSKEAILSQILHDNDRFVHPMPSHWNIAAEQVATKPEEQMNALAPDLVSKHAMSMSFSPPIHTDSTHSLSSFQREEDCKSYVCLSKHDMRSLRGHWR